VTEALRFGALDTRLKAERVADAVEERIRSGGVAPGEPLGTKGQLATGFSVSPATMDAALRVLVDRGLVAVRQGAKGGVTVAEDHHFLSLGAARWPLRHLAPDDVTAQRQAASVALALEPLILAESIACATKDDRSRLRGAVRALDAVVDAEGYRVAHRQLHRTLLEAAHNTVLATLVPGLWAAVLEGDAPPTPPQGQRADEWAQERATVHRRIVDSVLARDLSRALAALHDHGAVGHDIDLLTAGYRALVVRGE